MKNTKEPLHRRLEAVRDIFNGRAEVTSVYDRSKRISFAEGGCLLPPHPHILKVMQDAARDITRYTYQIYPQQTVLDDFIGAVQEYFEKRCDISYTADTGTIIGFGSSHIFDCLLGAVCRSGDVILAPEGYYHSFSEFPVKWGAQMSCINTLPENGFKLTASELKGSLAQAEADGRNVGALVLTNPTTTGAIYTRQELEELAQVIKTHDLLVYADEVFRDSEFSGQQVISLAALEGMQEHVVTAGSGSKTHGTADFRIGWACGPASVIDQMVNVMEHSVTEIPLYLQGIGKAIIETPQSYLDEARQEYEIRAERVAKNVRRVNRNLNTHFGTDNVAYLDIPYKPQAGHYLSLNMNALKGFSLPSGKVLESNPDLCRYLYDPDFEAGDAGQGVVFSSGYSKGHDDFTVYIAFAQLGFDKVSMACQPQIDRVLRDAGEIDAANAKNLYNRADIPELAQAYHSGREMIDDAFTRVEAALKKLTPAVLAPGQHSTARRAGRGPV